MCIMGDMAKRFSKDERRVIRQALGAMAAADDFADLRGNKGLWAAFRSLSRSCGYRRARKLDVAALRTLEGQG